MFCWTWKGVCRKGKAYYNGVLCSVLTIKASSAILGTVTSATTLGEFGLHSSNYNQTYKMCKPENLFDQSHFITSKSSFPKLTLHCDIWWGGFFYIVASWKLCFGMC